MKLTKEQLRQNELLIQDLIDKAIKYKGETKEIILKKEIILYEDDTFFKAHSVSICNRELSFSCDNGHLGYTIDTIGFNDYLILESLELSK